jgi:hypothetical protein
MKCVSVNLCKFNLCHVKPCKGKTKYMYMSLQTMKNSEHVKQIHLSHFT